MEEGEAGGVVLRLFGGPEVVGGAEGGAVDDDGGGEEWGVVGAHPAPIVLGQPPLPLLAQLLQLLLVHLLLLLLRSERRREFRRPRGVWGLTRATGIARVRVFIPGLLKKGMF